MKPRDVMPFGERRFLLHFFEHIPEQIQFGQYYPAMCEITSPDGAIARVECIACWPTNRLNVAGQSLGNWLLVPVVTDMPGDLLHRSEIEITGYGSAISEEAARDSWGVGPAWRGFR